MNTLTSVSTKALEESQKETSGRDSEPEKEKVEICYNWLL